MYLMHYQWKLQKTNHPNLNSLLYIQINVYPLRKNSENLWKNNAKKEKIRITSSQKKNKENRSKLLNKNKIKRIFPIPQSLKLLKVQKKRNYLNFHSLTKTFQMKMISFSVKHPNHSQHSSYKNKRRNRRKEKNQQKKSSHL